MPIRMSPDDIRAVYRQGEDTVVGLISMLIDRLNSLEEEVTRLKGVINKDSHNSSKPPSTDFHRPVPKSLRQKGQKKSGGQPGHQGFTLQRAKTPDHRIIHPITGRCACGKLIRDGRFIDFERRQVADIPPPKALEYTEHCAEIFECSCGKVHTAPFPEGIYAPIQYGERIRAYLAYFSIYQLLPQKRCIEMLYDIFGIPMSEGTVNNTLQLAYRNLETTEEAIKNAIRNSPTMHLDETGMYVNGDRLWGHGCGTPLYTYYFCHEQRGSVAIEAGGMLFEYLGRIIHDGWKSYFDFECLHALCNAHHLRELVFIKEQYKQTWAGNMIELLCRIKTTVDRAKEAKRPQLASATLQRYRNRYRRLIAAGYRANPAPQPQERKDGQRGKLKQHPARNLLDRLCKYESEALAFTYDFNVPFDNNLAERDLRMNKVKQKVSGCFRSIAGAKAFCRIRGYISTVRKHGFNTLDYLLKVFQTDGSVSLLLKTT
jgi:transposase